MENSFDTFIFDLDGTLLDTVPDLILLTNRILDAMDKPHRSREDVIRFVGGGLDQFLRLSLPEDATNADLRRALELWNEWYTGYYEATDPYDGIPELLGALEARGCKCAVFSNRDKEGVDILLAKSPLDGFALTLGTGPLPEDDTIVDAAADVDISGQIARKPEPDGILVAMEVLDAEPSHTLYIGDTPTDIAAGHAAGCATAAVLWGYHSEEELLAEHPDIVVSHPLDLLHYAI